MPCKPQLPVTPLTSRGILSADHKVNHFSAALRRAIAPYLESTVKGNQSGAIKKGGTEFPMFIARLFLQRAAKLNKSAALIFGDLLKAYSSVLVELVLGPVLTEGERQTVLDRLQCDSLRQQVLAAETVARRSLFGDIELPLNLHSVVQEWLRLPWFTVQGCPDFFVHNIRVKNRGSFN